MRIQFPLRISAAKTIHKSQGDTLNEVVVDMTATRCFPHSHYVAFSRVTSLSGLYITELNDKKISVTNSVVKEMSRLRQDAPITLCYTTLYKIESNLIKISFINARSLNKHIHEIRADHNLIESDILGVAETWLTNQDQNENLVLQGHEMYRKDSNAGVGNSRPHRGIVLYVKETVDVVSIQDYSDLNIEFIYANVLVDGKCVQIVTFYRSNSCTFEVFKHSVVSKLFPLIKIDSPLVIQGDFNYDLNKGQKQFVQFVEKRFSCQQLVVKPTHNSGLLLDHIFCNIPNTKTDVIDTIWSDHSIIYVAFKNI
jgi:hypothetical protein